MALEELEFVVFGQFGVVVHATGWPTQSGSSWIALEEPDLKFCDTFGGIVDGGSDMPWASVIACSLSFSWVAPPRRRPLWATQFFPFRGLRFRGQAVIRGRRLLPATNLIFLF